MATRSEQSVCGPSSTRFIKRDDEDDDEGGDVIITGGRKTKKNINLTCP